MCLQCSMPFLWDPMDDAPCWCSSTGTARSVELYDTERQRHIYLERGFQRGFQCCVPLVYVLTERDREREKERDISPTVFKLCLYVSPDCECATAFHNGGHCLFGGESVGILFQSFLEVLCLTRWGFSTSCGWRQACCLLISLPLLWRLSSLPSVSSFESSNLRHVHTCGGLQWCGSNTCCNFFDYLHSRTDWRARIEGGVVLRHAGLGWKVFKVWSFMEFIQSTVMAQYPSALSLPLTAAPLIPLAVLQWHFTSPTCTDSSLIQLRANLSQGSCVDPGLNTASHCRRVEEGQLTGQLTHQFVLLSPSLHRFLWPSSDMEHLSGRRIDPYD